MSAEAVLDQQRVSIMVEVFGRSSSSGRGELPACVALRCVALRCVGVGGCIVQVSVEWDWRGSVVCLCLRQSSSGAVMSR